MSEQDIKLFGGIMNRLDNAIKLLKQDQRFDDWSEEEISAYLDEKPFNDN